MTDNWKNSPLTKNLKDALDYVEAYYYEDEQYKDTPKSNKTPSDISFHSNTDQPIWNGTDPKGELKILSPVMAFFIYHVRFKRFQFEFDWYGAGDPDEKGTIELGVGVDESIDYYENEERIIFYPIAYCDDIQSYYGLNLLDKSDDPKVYKSDHYPMEPCEDFESLSDFLLCMDKS